MKNKRYFPMFIDLSDKKIVVVGGGNVAIDAARISSSLQEILRQLHRNRLWSCRNLAKPVMSI